jgi:hypothetical protein
MEADDADEVVLYSSSLIIKDIKIFTAFVQDVSTN